MTITVRLPEELESSLRKRLAREEMALSEFVRRAIAEKLEREPPPRKSAYELGKHLLGKYDSGRTDLSTNADQIVREKIRAKHSR
jgi:Arc/MetJ-type ribon-helix-helix transcriptional regulator